MSDLNQAQPAVAPTRPTRMVLAVTYLAVAVIVTITAAVSYEHEYELAHHNGQAPWVSSLLPFTVDGMLLATSVVLVWAAAEGLRRPWRPLAVLLVGIAATIAANLASGLGHGWLGAAVAAWCGFALILISDVAMWLTGAKRRLASGEPEQPRATRKPAPPPLTLAEWATAAQAWLRDHGEPSGEQALADRIGTTRHQVRTALAPKAPEPVLNGSGPHE